MYVQFWFNNQGFITVFNQVLQTIDGDKYCHQSGVRFSFCKTDINLIDLERHFQPFDLKYALRSLRILNWAQLEMRTSSISKLMKSKGQPKMGIHIVFRKYMYFRQTGSRMKTSQCEISFSWAKTRNAFYSNCRTFAHPSSDLGVANCIQIERTTQPAK